MKKSSLILAGFVLVALVVLFVATRQDKTQPAPVFTPSYPQPHTMIFKPLVDKCRKCKQP